jgi:hypothetical protein
MCTDQSISGLVSIPAAIAPSDLSTDVPIAAVPAKNAARRLDICVFVKTKQIKKQSRVYII